MKALKAILSLACGIVFIPLMPVGYAARIAWLALSIGWYAAKEVENGKA